MRHTTYMATRKHPACLKRAMVADFVTTVIFVPRISQLRRPHGALVLHESNIRNVRVRRFTPVRRWASRGRSAVRPLGGTQRPSGPPCGIGIDIPGCKPARGSHNLAQLSSDSIYGERRPIAGQGSFRLGFASALRMTPKAVSSTCPIRRASPLSRHFGLVYDSWLRAKGSRSITFLLISLGCRGHRNGPPPASWISATEPRERQACSAHASQSPHGFYALQSRVTRFRSGARISTRGNLRPPRAKPGVIGASGKISAAHQ